MDLNTILIILGVIALIALVAHGVWSNRREKSQIFENDNRLNKDQPVRQLQENHHYMAQPDAATPPTQPQASTPPTQQSGSSDTLQASHTTYQQEEQQNVEQAINQIKISLPNDPQPVQHSVEPVASYQAPQHFASATISEIEANLNEEEGIYAQPHFAETSSMNSGITIEHERPTVEFTEVEQTAQATAEQPTQQRNETAQDFLMLYIVSPEDREFNGVTLAKVLDDLGFIFGHQHIYHRHLDLNSTSPVLFSAANIQQPGTFEPNTMADFYTVGIALFMQLPSPGNDLVNLRMMIRAAKTIAEELGGFVLTDQQEIFDENAEKAYLAKVSM
ncbi:cell division protein ZipA [Avibacterium paragallinarum]|uniref:cell division protein ZipA n=1 Tax=Avibacterium paragallinarum TaxID=728 RepID=UPI00397CE036